MGQEKGLISGTVRTVKRNQQTGAVPGIVKPPHVFTPREESRMFLRPEKILEL